jgi:hypothetical protein
MLYFYFLSTRFIEDLEHQHQKLFLSVISKWLDSKSDFISIYFSAI